MNSSLPILKREKEEDGRRREDIKKGENAIRVGVGDKF